MSQWKPICSVDDIPVLGARRVTRAQVTDWTVGLEGGCAQAPDEGCTPRFNVKVDAGQIYLDLDELSTLALDNSKALA
ncbi:hypothetical protein [Aquabacterium sp.]|uniref:hypothetical protein n=1 Tax=Aquabacterium sp. TaxID=1872578 RepID=UPI0019A52727|nr:hypothetical protein [Aquabacterium sp.]MBC7699351.1 hypothetical protein [Aquabacterium sp.]